MNGVNSFAVKALKALREGGINLHVRTLSTKSNIQEQRSKTKNTNTQPKNHPPVLQQKKSSKKNPPPPPNLQSSLHQLCITSPDSFKHLQMVCIMCNALESGGIPFLHFANKNKKQENGPSVKKRLRPMRYFRLQTDKKKCSWPRAPYDFSKMSHLRRNSRVGGLPSPPAAVVSPPNVFNRSLPKKP